MGKRHLNYFHPFERLPEGWEDQLTRAALTLMRLVPMAHGELLRRADPGRMLVDLPMAEMETQTSSLHPKLESQIKAGAVDPGDGPRVISVFLAPDVEDRLLEVSESDRTPRFDGVIRYGDELIIVIESKLNELVDARQAQEIPLGPLSGHCRLEKAILVRWHELTDAWLRLDEQGLLGFAERGLLNDFFEMAEESFPDVLPFKTLARAEPNEVRIRRRLRSLIGQAVNLEPTSDDWGCHVLGGWKTFQRVWLGRVNQQRVNLAMWPGVQKPEALRLYGEPSRARAVAALHGTETGHARWDVSPSLSVTNWRPPTRQSFDPDLTLDEYVDLWIDETSQIRRRRADELDALFNWLVSENLTTPDHRQEFDAKFIQPTRNQVDLHPSLRVVAYWEWPDAVALDDDNSRFVQEIRDVIDTALDAVGEERLPPPSE